MIRFLRATRSVALTLAFVAAIVAPAFSLDRVQFLFGENPPSNWVNMSARDTRLGVGQFMFNAIGAGNSYFANLCTTPSTGLNITVGPCSTNSLAALYQYLPEETSAFGGPGATALPVDNTNVEIQGLMNNAQALTIGPLNPPGTSGQSIIYAIECKDNTVDTTAQTVNFVSSSGVVTSGSANRDRADQISCQAKAGTAAPSPVAPTIDTGYVGVSNVTVPYAASSITSGNIVAIVANQIGGFVEYDGNGNVGINGNMGLNRTTGPNIIVSSTNGSNDALILNAINGTTGRLVDFQNGGTLESAIGPYGQIEQGASACGAIACRAQLVSGSYTWTFGHAFVAIPVCVATGESSSNVLHVTPSATGCTVTSSSGTDSEWVDIMVVANPN